MNVLFLCIGNAGRSQMAEALFAAQARGAHEVRSAGSSPATRVHEEVVAAMNELGIDLSKRAPRALAESDAEWADVVVTMGCGDECPYIPGKRYVDWDLPDPKGMPIDGVRELCADIEARVAGLVAELDRPSPG